MRTRSPPASTPQGMFRGSGRSLWRWPRRIAERVDRRHRRLQDERRRRKQYGDGAVSSTKHGDARRAQMVQVVRAPRAQCDGRLRRAALPELVGVDAQRQPGASGRVSHRCQVLERERDVLHVDVDLIGESLGCRRRDQLVHTARTHPARDIPFGTAWHASDVTEQLRRRLRERACQPRLSELSFHGESVPGLQFHHGRPVRRHLVDEGSTDDSTSSSDAVSCRARASSPPPS